MANDRHTNRLQDESMWLQVKTVPCSPPGRPPAVLTDGPFGLDRRSCTPNGPHAIVSPQPSSQPATNHRGSTPKSTTPRDAPQRLAAVTTPAALPSRSHRLRHRLAQPDRVRQNSQQPRPQMAAQTPATANDPNRGRRRLRLTMEVPFCERARTVPKRKSPAPEGHPRGHSSPNHNPLLNRAG